MTALEKNISCVAGRSLSTELLSAWKAVWRGLFRLVPGSLNWLEAIFTAWML